MDTLLLKTRMEHTDVGRLVGVVLDATVARARVRDASSSGTRSAPVITCFHATHDADLAVSAYIKRMVSYGRPSESCFLIAVVLMDRIILALPKGFSLSGLSVHRLFGVCVLLATKMNDDIYYSNAHWAKVLGVGLQELNGIEVSALRLLQWRVHVTGAEFAEYLDVVTMRAGELEGGVGGVKSSAAAATTTTTKAATVPRISFPSTPSSSSSSSSSSSHETASKGGGKTDHECEIVKSPDTQSSNHSTPTKGSRGWSGAASTFAAMDESNDDFSSVSENGGSSKTKMMMKTTTSARAATSSSSRLTSSTSS